MLRGSREKHVFISGKVILEVGQIHRMCMCPFLQVLGNQKDRMIVQSLPFPSKPN